MSSEFLSWDRARYSVEVFSSMEAMNRRAAGLIADTANSRETTAETFNIVLAGGATPEQLYRLLISKSEGYRSSLPWHRMHFFYGDERQVPPDHADSNFRMTLVSMLQDLDLNPAQIHRIKGEMDDPGQAAKAYSKEIREHFNLDPDTFPEFDFVLLGMGADGHTASIFPETGPVLAASDIAAAVWVGKLNSWRITLTSPVLNSAKTVVFLVTGAAKAEALRHVITGPAAPAQYPAQLIRPVKGRMYWLVHDSAAEGLF